METKKLNSICTSIVYYKPIFNHLRDTLCPWLINMLILFSKLLIKKRYVCIHSEEFIENSVMLDMIYLYVFKI